ncbi:calcium-binding protein [Catenuloplanes atrovinosus]|uniref:Ca2+-binding RTX toxin-like protein n=1 Tax=Catenuloplanes atrovinosus TaxID=137266 RepID=A0AAE3YML6_9ACTN|nr:calcium-binding protein [Catenuloplanes atrovinosus]MDR7274974.1 Ca2+-binding RTX toxin-like protein [Catenuloplanes atrovinosus]
MYAISRAAGLTGGIAALAAAGFIVTAVPAHAAAAGSVVAVTDGVFTEFVAGAGQVNDLLITGAGSSLTFTDVHPITAGPGCTAVAGTTVTCDVGTPENVYALQVRVLDGRDIVRNESSTAVMIYGGAGDDTLIGSDSAGDELHAEEGDDTVDGRSGNDTVSGGEGRDTVRGGAGDDDVNGTSPFGPADDGDDVLHGGDGDDTVGGGAGSDLVDGGAGDDVLYGDQDGTGAGEDTLLGGDGDDDLIGGLRADVLDGGAGRDAGYYTERETGVVASLNGVRGDDGEPGEGDSLLAVESLYGSTGDDVLTGDDGDNVLEGGAGTDVIDGLGGDDRLIGGWGLPADTDRLDGGDHRTDAGDVCQLDAAAAGTAVACETVEHV